MKRKWDVTKIVLQELVLRLRAEEEFLKNINQVDVLYEVSFRPKEENPFYRILSAIGIEDEEEVEEIIENFLQESKEVEVLVDEFCQKYFEFRGGIDDF